MVPLKKMTTPAEISQALDNGGYGGCVFKAVRFSHTNDRMQDVYAVAFDSEEEPGSIELGFVFVTYKGTVPYGDF